MGKSPIGLIRLLGEGNIKLHSRQLYNTRLNSFIH